MNIMPRATRGTALLVVKRYEAHKAEADKTELRTSFFLPSRFHGQHLADTPTGNNFMLFELFESIDPGRLNWALVSNAAAGLRIDVRTLGLNLC